MLTSRSTAREVNLGTFDSQESRDQYDRVVGEWIGRGRPRGVPVARVGAVGGPLTVNQVIAGFWAHARTVYPCPPYAEGKRPGGELGNYWDALRRSVVCTVRRPRASSGRSS